MPRRVVPMDSLPRRISLWVSISTWYGMIRCAAPEMRRLLVSTPRSSNWSSSRTSTKGSTTTPLPMMQSVSGYRMPLGMRCSAYVWSPATMVWPALLPPW